MLKLVDIALLPTEAQAIEADCYIVIDVLRATTTIATLFGHGLHSLLAVSDIDLARERAKADGRLLFGEVEGLPPRGFDYGNSPVEAAKLDVRGRDAVLFTTNGTAALCAFPDAASVVTGSLANVSAVAAFAGRFASVVAVCAGNGRGTRFSLEDFLGAGAIAQAMVDAAPEAGVGDGAAAAMAALRSGRLGIAHSRHARYTESIGLGPDVTFSAQRDTSASVPRIVDQGPNWALLKDAALA